jgi:hypothetical protein
VIFGRPHSFPVTGSGGGEAATPYLQPTKIEVGFAGLNALNNRGLVTGQSCITCVADPNSAYMTTVFHVITGFPTIIHRIGLFPEPRPRTFQILNVNSRGGRGRKPAAKWLVIGHAGTYVE